MNFIPFTDKDGPGLYPPVTVGINNIANSPPEAYLALGKELAGGIKRLNVNGNPADNGKIGFMSIGMSNTKREWAAFMKIARTKANKGVVFIPGAQGSYDALRIADEKSPYWTNIDALIKRKGLSNQQVQVVWLKEAVSGEIDSFPAHAKELQGYLTETVAILKKRYTNLKLIFFSSRIYGGYAVKQVSPEPWAYQGAYAVKWLIEDWIKSGTKSPLLFWGPYLWADGLEGRESDKLIWECKDFESDGTHPSPTGSLKVANLLLDFFMTNELTEWFKQ